MVNLPGLPPMWNLTNQKSAEDFAAMFAPAAEEAPVAPPQDWLGLAVHQFSTWCHQVGRRLSELKFVDLRDWITGKRWDEQSRNEIHRIRSCAAQAFKAIQDELHALEHFEEAMEALARSEQDPGMELPTFAQVNHLIHLEDNLRAHYERITANTNQPPKDPYQDIEEQIHRTHLEIFTLLDSAWNIIDRDLMAKHDILEQECNQLLLTPSSQPSTDLEGKLRELEPFLAQIDDYNNVQTTTYTHAKQAYPEKIREQLVVHSRVRNKVQKLIYKLQLQLITNELQNWHATHDEMPAALENLAKDIVRKQADQAENQALLRAAEEKCSGIQLALKTNAEELQKLSILLTLSSPPTQQAPVPPTAPAVALEQPTQQGKGKKPAKAPKPSKPTKLDKITQAATEAWKTRINQQILKLTCEQNLLTKHLEETNGLITLTYQAKEKNLADAITQLQTRLQQEQSLLKMATANLNMLNQRFQQTTEALKDITARIVV